MSVSHSVKARASKLTLVLGVALLMLGGCTRWLPASARGWFALRIVTSGALPTGRQDAPYSAKLPVEGGQAPYHWALSGGFLPAGLSLADDGSISGKPEVPGEYWIDLAVRDSSRTPRTATETVVLRINSAGLAILTSSSELPWGRLGSPYSARLVAGGAAVPYTWKNAGGLPEGLTMNPRGVLSGAPVQAGDFKFTAEVANLNGARARRMFTLHVSPVQVDRFGGVISSTKAQPTGHWTKAKLGSRWVLVTPEGHPFFLLGVWFVAGDAHKDERGDSYDDRCRDKYGREAFRWLQANRRLHAWGFNAVGPYSYRMMLPTNSEPEWQGGDQPVKMPFVWIAHDPAITGRKEGVFKNLYAGVDENNHALRDQGGANFPDVFDPAWVRNTQEIFAKDRELAEMVKSPYLVGVFSDDTDYLSGFGPGPDFASQPEGKTHVHLGYLALVTAPAQQTNKDGNGRYADTKVYTKLRLHDFLREKYGTIDRLNTAWQASYTTFESDGGWPGGKGLLDESGRAAHAWLGAANPALTPETHANANMVRDLDEFLYLIARQFFSTEKQAFSAVAPNTLFFGPTTVGGWWAPARAPIYRAAGESLDLISLSTNASQQQVDYVLRAAGDVPLMIWEGTVANADSSRWRMPKDKDGPSHWFTQTQTERAERYRQDVIHLFETQASNGVHPFVGHLWWAWGDSLPEERNWGLVSPMDNAYDGMEDGRTRGFDPWGFPFGGEERNYGNFLGPVRAINFSISEQLANEQH